MKLLANLLLVLLAVFASDVFRDDSCHAGEAADDGVMIAAGKGLLIFQQLITGENAETFDLKKDFGESPKVELQAPLRIFLVRSEQLKQFQEGSDPGQLVFEVNQRVFPIKVNGEVRSSLTVAKIKGDKWEPIEYKPQDKLAALFVKYREAESFLVQVNDLKLFFLGIRKTGQLSLTPIFNFPKYEFRAGQALPAKQVFLKLSRDAAAYKGGLGREMFMEPDRPSPR